MGIEKRFTGTISDIIFFVCFALLFGARAVGLYDGQPVYNAILLAGMAFFVLKVITTRHTFLEYCVIGLFMLLGVAVYYFSGEKGLLLYFTMMLGMKSISEEKVIRLGYTILSISYLVLFILSISGLIENLNHMNKRGDYGFVMRHSLGYPYPNTTHTTFLILVILFFYLVKNESLKKQILYSIGATIISLYLYVYTVSLTGVISISIFLVVNLYLHIRDNRSKLENILILLLFPVVVLFSILGPVLIKGEAFAFMDSLLHSRYEYALYFLENESITPFGSYFGATPTSWYMLDNSFLYLFLQLGVVTFSVICVLYILWIRYIIRENKKSELAVMITFCFIGMSDPFLFNLSYKNLTFLFIGTWLFKALEKQVQHMPALFQKEILIIPAGEKEVDFSWQFLEKTDRALHSLKNELFAHPKKYLLVFTIVCAITSFAYSMVSTEPEILYVDEDTADPYLKHKTVEMTPEDVISEREKGNLVESYSEDDPTMYIFKDTAPRLEHQRMILTNGVMAGLIITLTASSLAAIRKGNSTKK